MNRWELWMLFALGILVGTLVGVGVSRRPVDRRAAEFVPQNVTLHWADKNETIRVYKYAGGPEEILSPKPGDAPAYQITLEANGERRYILGTPVTSP